LFIWRGWFLRSQCSVARTNNYQGKTNETNGQK
jgi:hypothetical protein